MPLDITAANVISFTDSGQEFHLITPVVPSGAYPAGGEPIATCTTAGGKLFGIEPVKTASNPKSIVMFTAPAVGGGAILYHWTFDKANGKLICYLGSTGAELAGGAYPADVTGGVTTINAWFKKA